MDKYQNSNAGNLQIWYQKDGGNEDTFKWFPFSPPYDLWQEVMAKWENAARYADLIIMKKQQMSNVDEFTLKIQIVQGCYQCHFWLCFFSFCNFGTISYHLHSIIECKIAMRGKGIPMMSIGKINEMYSIPHTPNTTKYVQTGALQWTKPFTENCVPRITTINTCKLLQQKGKNTIRADEGTRSNEQNLSPFNAHGG